MNVVRIGAYLACSWTWVIGMFLPVLLVRDLGVWGWAIFAVPNVVGAAAMGRLVRSPDDSRRMVRDHAAAVRAFAVVTIAFQIFFLGGLLPQLVGPAAWAGFGVALVAAAVPVWRRFETGVMLAPLVWLASVGLVAAALVGGVGTMPAGEPAAGEAAGLAIACAFGFGLCPYLDPTFHRARQLAGAAGPAAFGVGFGVFFLVMIAGTLLYAPAWLAGAVGPLVALHVVLQATFTVAAHRRELPDVAGGGPAWLGGMGRLTVAGLAVGLLLAIDAAVVAAIWPDVRPLGRFTLPELIYRGFLGFYGLFFPAYVWLMIVGRAAPPARQDWLVYAAAVALALPFFAVGFLGGPMIWVGVGMVPVLLAKGFVRPITPAGG